MRGRQNVGANVLKIIEHFLSTGYHLYTSAYDGRLYTHTQ